MNKCRKCGKKVESEYFECLFGLCSKCAKEYGKEIKQESIRSRKEFIRINKKYKINL